MTRQRSVSLWCYSKPAKKQWNWFQGAVVCGRRSFFGSPQTTNTKNQICFSGKISSKKWKGAILGSPIMICVITGLTSTYQARDPAQMPAIQLFSDTTKSQNTMELSIQHESQNLTAVVLFFPKKMSTLGVMAQKWPKVAIPPALHLFVGWPP